MGPVALALLVMALVVAAPFASRRLRSGRIAQRAGRPVGPPPAAVTGRGAAVPRPEVQPAGNERQPFSYDSGLIIGEVDP
jgi:hypothetical protein